MEEGAACLRKTGRVRTELVRTLGISGDYSVKVGHECGQ